MLSAFSAQLLVLSCESTIRVVLSQDRTSQAGVGYYRSPATRRQTDRGAS